MEFASFHTCATLDTFALIDFERLLHFSADCSYRALTGALTAALAKLRIDGVGQKRLALAGRTVLIQYMCHVLVTEIL